MSITDLNALVAIILAIALAGERVVTFLKNTIPWFADDPKDASGMPASNAEWLRRPLIQALGFFAAWSVAAFLTEKNTWDLGGAMQFGSQARGMPVWIVGLLASSGSAMWSSVLGITSAAKDLRKQAAVAGGENLKERLATDDAVPPLNVKRENLKRG